jgi:hypothetical protein
VEGSKFCLFSVIMPAKCVSSISPRFHYRMLAFCFLPLAPSWNSRCPGLIEIVIGWGRIWFACSLRSSLRRQVVSQRSRVCWRQVF